MYSQVSLVTQAPLDSIFNGPEVSLSNNVRVTTWSQAENSRNCITWKYRATFTRIAEVIVQEPNWTSQKAVPSQRSTEISLSLSLSLPFILYPLSFNYFRYRAVRASVQQLASTRGFLEDSVLELDWTPMWDWNRCDTVSKVIVSTLPVKCNSKRRFER